MEGERRRVRDGSLMRFKSGLFSKKWKECYTVLWSDSTFEWFDEKGDEKPVSSVVLEHVVPFICIGVLTNEMPVSHPAILDGSSIHHLVAIALDSKADTVHWFMFSSDSDLEAWFIDIKRTLPKDPENGESSLLPGAEGNSTLKPPSPRPSRSTLHTGGSRTPSRSRSRSPGGVGRVFSSFGKHFSKGKDVVKTLANKKSGSKTNISPENGDVYDETPGGESYDDFGGGMSKDNAASNENASGAAHNEDENVEYDEEDGTMDDFGGGMEGIAQEEEDDYGNDEGDAEKEADDNNAGMKEGDDYDASGGAYSDFGGGNDDS